MIIILGTSDQNAKPHFDKKISDIDDRDRDHDNDDDGDDVYDHHEILMKIMNMINIVTNLKIVTGTHTVHTHIRGIHTPKISHPNSPQHPGGIHSQKISHFASPEVFQCNEYYS